MIKIAIIKENKCSFDNIEEMAKPLLYKKLSDTNRRQLKDKLNEYLWSIIEPYVEFREVMAEDMMDTICESIHKSYPNDAAENLYFHTEQSFSSPSKYLELIYAQDDADFENIKEGDKYVKPNMNNLGCIFSIQHKIVNRTCVIIANKYDLENSMKKYLKITSVEKKDILRVIRRRYFHSAVYVQENEMMTKYYYQDPSILTAVLFKLTYSNTSNKDTEMIHHVEFNLFNYNLTFYFDNDGDEETNQIATRLYGLARIRGPVLILHILDDTVDQSSNSITRINSSISIPEVERLNKISFGPLASRQPKENELIRLDNIAQKIDEEEAAKDPSIPKKTYPIWSRYLIVKSRLKDFVKEKNICINCHGSINEPVICNICYRNKCCSAKCLDNYMRGNMSDCVVI